MPDRLTAARLLRGVARRGAHTLAQWWWRTTVRAAPADAGGFRVRSWPPGTGSRLRGGRLRLVLPDAAALARLTSSGLLTGQVRRLDLTLGSAPDWQVAGIRPPRPGRTVTAFTWRRQGRWWWRLRRGHRLRVRIRWSRPYDTHRALRDAGAAVLRPQPWDQTSGPLPPAASGAGGTALANPYGRTLVGAATRYALVRGPGRVGLRDGSGTLVWHTAAAVPSSMAKYAVVSVHAPDGDVAEPFPADAMRTLAACGVVFASPDPAVRAALAGLGLVTVADPAQVTDLAGYALSVAAARQAMIAADPTLRLTPLASDGGPAPGDPGAAVALPAVTAVVSSMRAEHLDTLFGYLARQAYPALEAVVGLHGYELPEPARQRLCAMVPYPVRIVPVPAEQPFGAVLGRLTRMADGELVTKLDDDDHYGPHHVTDLVLARHTTGADLVAKGARFVHFPERGETVDRAWAAPEVFDVTPAGGTLLLSRGTLAQAGGWSHAVRHVDADLLDRIRSAGGLVYRTHALEYVYVRRAAGHTFAAESDELRAQGERTYPGLPREIIDPDPLLLEPERTHDAPDHRRHARRGVLR